MENIYIKQDLCIDFNCKIKLILFYVISGVLFISNKFQSYFFSGGQFTKILRFLSHAANKKKSVPKSRPLRNLVKTLYSSVRNTWGCL